MKRCVTAFGVVLALACATGVQAQSSAWRSREKVEPLTKRIDAIIATAQKSAGVTPLPPADAATFYRRLHLDLAGVIPPLTHIVDFVDDDDPAKLWRQWSEQLIDSKTFSRHFAAVLRAHLLTGANQQGQAFGPPFELWVRQQIQKDAGYDAIVRAILEPNAEGMNGMGANGSASPIAFYLGAENKAENLAGAASRVFLGVKLECAQCHAHPFAKWSRDQFWEFAAFFNGTQPNVRRFNQIGEGLAPVSDRTREIKIPGTDKVVKAKFLTGEEPKWKANDATRTVLADWTVSPKNPYFAKATADFVWSYFFGISLLEPILEPSDDSPVTHPELLEVMAEALIANNFDLKFLIRAIVHTEAYQRASAGAGTVGRDDYVLFTRMPVRGLSPEQLYDSVLEATVGDVNGPAEPNYQANQVGFNRPGDARAEFLAKFASTERRHESQTSILQALYLMNGKFLAEKIKNNPSIDRLVSAPQHKLDRRIRSLYMLTLSRPPRPEELSRLVAYIEQGSDPRQRFGDIFWAVLNSAEFRLNH